MTNNAEPSGAEKKMESANLAKDSERVPQQQGKPGGEMERKREGESGRKMEPSRHEGIDTAKA